MQKLLKNEQRCTVKNVTDAKKPIDGHNKPTLNHGFSKVGQIAQLVEQRTENPCVPSSILGLATTLYFVKVAGFVF